jgi:hypothetical protein
MAVPMSTTPTTITPGAPRTLFTLADKLQFTQTGTKFRFGYTYEVLPGTKDILGVAVARAARSATGDDGNATAPRINVVLNWFEELKKLVPVE